MFRQDYTIKTGQPVTISVPRPGEYKISVSITSREPLGTLTVSTGAGSIAFQGNIPGMSFQHGMNVCAGDFIPSGKDRICDDRTLTVSIITHTSYSGKVSVREAPCPSIYLAAATQPDTTDRRADLQPRLACFEWGRVFATCTRGQIAVSDHSRPGLTADSFRRSGQYAAVCQYSRPGDYILFQFDHSRLQPTDLKAGGCLRRQLTRYVIECSERMIYPLLLTSAVCCHTEKNRHLDALNEQYADACREVGRITHIPVIEIHKNAPQVHSALAMAELIAREISQVCERRPERGYRFLAKCLAAA